MNPFGVLSGIGVGQKPSCNTVSLPNGLSNQGVYAMRLQLDALGRQCRQPRRSLAYQNDDFRSPPSYAYNLHPDEVFNQAGSQFEGFQRIDGYWEEFDMRLSPKARLRHRNHRLAIQVDLRRQGRL
jgi:hypothetical protein